MPGAAGRDTAHQGKSALHEANRAVAQVVGLPGLFGADRIPERAWKTHDLRNRTIRLVQSGLALMRGGYRDLLRQARRKK